MTNINQQHNYSNPKNNYCFLMRTVHTFLKKSEVVWDLAKLFTMKLLSYCSVSVCVCVCVRYSLD